MSGRLVGKTALVTGGGAGIGAATAQAFCREGAAVLIVDRDAAALAATATRVLEAVPGARLACLAADVSDESMAQAAVAQALHTFGGLDVLVNNAAARNYSALAEASMQEWQALLEVNLLGAASFCRAALPALRRSGRGSIVMVSSCYAVTGRKGMGLYDASKAAQLSMVRTLAFEEAAQGLRVNAVCPGSTLTDFHLARADAAGKSVEQLRSERQSTSMLGRWAEPHEIALPILWLASDEASFITGTTLMVDGGLSAM